MINKLQRIVQALQACSILFFTRGVAPSFVVLAFQAKENELICKANYKKAISSQPLGVPAACRHNFHLSF